MNDDPAAERLLPVIQKATDHPCFECALCCTYVAVEIDTPTTGTEYDQIVWYLYHRDVEVFVDWDDAWHVLFRTRCENLSAAGTCGIYERRPGICKDFDWRGCEKRFTPADGPPDDRRAIGGRLSFMCPTTQGRHHGIDTDGSGRLGRGVGEVRASRLHLHGRNG